MLRDYYTWIHFHWSTTQSTERNTLSGKYIILKQIRNPEYVFKNHLSKSHTIQNNTNYKNNCMQLYN